MDEKTGRDKAAEIVAFAESVEDPVFRQNLMAIAAAMQLATEFKRIDMAFLQMRGEGGLPKFALLDYDDFRDGKLCTLTQNGFSNDAGQLRFGEFFKRGDFFTDQTAMPKSVVPESVAAIVEQNRERFDELLVAWEADWQPRKGDPIVIGRKSGYFYIVATWDLTKLESFVAGVFAG